MFGKLAMYSCSTLIAVTCFAGRVSCMRSTSRFTSHIRWKQLQWQTLRAHANQDRFISIQGVPCARRQ
eukprot:8418941-Prorocentrum_lima.AAC.1